MNRKHVLAVCMCIALEAVGVTLRARRNSLKICRGELPSNRRMAHRHSTWTCTGKREGKGVVGEGSRRGGDGEEKGGK